MAAMDRAGCSRAARRVLQILATLNFAKLLPPLLGESEGFLISTVQTICPAPACSLVRIGNPFHEIGVC